MRTLLFTLAFSAMVLAQGDRGTIAGTVTDVAAAVLPGVAVTATHVDTGTTARSVSNEGGEYSIPSLAPGLYRVRFEVAGFKSAVHENVRLDAGTTARVDSKLEVGIVQQSISVEASANQLQTDDAKVQNTIDDRMIEALPTVVSGQMRSPFDLAAITPQVQGGDQDFRIGGGQAGSFGVMLDGTSANTNRAGSTAWAAVNAPSLDAITQFAVETNGFKAEFGRAGGGVVSFVSKSGTNSYHGTAFDFIRNNAFDARGFFNSTTPVYRQHDFGFTAGGPISVPKLYNGKNKTFFFFSYEGFRNRVGGQTTATALPPKEFYDGDFRNAVSRNKNPDGTYRRYIVYDPDTTVYNADIRQYQRQAFPNNTIPRSRVDPLAAKLLDIGRSTLTSSYRTDVVPGTPEYWLENYWQRGTSVNPNDKYSLKLDHVLTPTQRLSAYIAYSKRQGTPGPTGPPGIPGILNQFSRLEDTSNVYRGSWDATLSSTIHNRFSFGANIFHDSNFPMSEGGEWKDKICVPNTPDCNRNLPIINMGDFPQWGGSGFNGSENPTYTFTDDLNWSRGKHMFKVGYLWEIAPYVGLGQQAGAGNLTFGTGSTNLPGQSGRDAAGGMGFASFMLGLGSGATIHTPRRVAMKWRYHAMYVQDDWRVTPKLTVNYGLRYEFNLPALNEGNQCADFDPTVPNPGASGRPGALVFCGTGDGRVGRDTIPGGWFMGFGPRLGFSWNPMAKTVIRSSFALSYAPVKSISGSAHAQGFSQTLSFPDQTGGITPVFRLNEGVPFWPKPPFIDPTFSNNGDPDWWQGAESNRLPGMYSWTLTLQRELPSKMILEAGYSAIVGTHLIANLLQYNQVNINTLPDNLNIFTNSGRNLLNTTFDNANRLVQNAGFSKPYTEFPNNFTLARALKPFPQYNTINTANSGDHSGHSSYHSLLLKLNRRYARDLIVDFSYVFSKMFTDSDSMWGSGAAIDMYNRRLEKSLSAYDRTHEVKMNYVYELPVGKGKTWFRKGLLAQTIGGWRIGAVQRYASGVPLGLTGAFGFPIIGNRPTIDTYEGWRAPLAGDKFDPYKDRFFQPATIATWSGDNPTITTQGWFPLQQRSRVGNMTKVNPKVRNFPLFNEDISLAKTFSLPGEARRTVDLRFEAFNLLNRTVFSAPNANLADASNFGLVRNQANSPRRMQFALKLNW